MTTHKPIHELSDILISRIAAGEVVERPGSVVKELVENSLDAGSSLVTVKIVAGGRSLISVQDDGLGIKKSELPLAIKRHATSKIEGNNLLEISSFGFRGEGLASIASVSKLELVSKYYEDDQAYQINIDGGKAEEISSGVLSKGTIITVRDLFFATPARLKFLKSERSENIYITELIKKFALAHPKVSFKLIINDKEVLFYKETGFEERLVEVLGKEFMSNSISLSYKQGEYEFSGYISLPTYNRASNNLQYSFINSRLVKDKIILNAIKVAYQDYLAKDRYPACVIFINLPYHEVDVNVHPAKSEVRFRDSQKIRNMLIAALKDSLAKGAFKAAPEIAQKTLASFNVGQRQDMDDGNRSRIKSGMTDGVGRSEATGRLPCSVPHDGDDSYCTESPLHYVESSLSHTEVSPHHAVPSPSHAGSSPYHAEFPPGHAGLDPASHAQPYNNQHSKYYNSINSGVGESSPTYRQSHISSTEINRAIEAGMPEEQANLAFSKEELSPMKEDISNQIVEEYIDYPLGSAVAQLHKTYIISQTKDGLIIVDQHAAHERLVYERLKTSLKESNIKTQKHLFSEIVELEPEHLSELLEYQEKLKEFGVVIEKFGSKGVTIKETPEVFQEIDIKRFIKDLSDNVIEYGELLNLEEKFTEIYGNYACKNSVRAGRKLNIYEMNQMLRDMEKTPFSGQCNHGRPSYVELKKGDLDKLFGR